MTRIYITRHGQTHWNLEGRMQGGKDSPLTELGKQQAKSLGARLADVPFGKVVTSSSGRAVETARLIRGDLEWEIHEVDEWQEIDLGGWEGLKKDELEEMDAVNFRKFWEEPNTYVPNQGESFQDVIQRASSEIEKVTKTKSPVLVVTHAIVLKALLAYFHNKELKDFWTGQFMHQTSLTVVEKKNDKWNVVVEADTTHHEGV